MAFKLATWNVEGRLSDYAHGKRGSAEHILDGIAAINADVLVLPEAYLGDQPAEGINDRLQAMGYEWRDVRYGDQDRDWSQEFMASMPSLRVLSRLAIINSEHVQWGNLRNLLVLTVRDPDTEKDVRIIATHLDDRTSEHRKRQIEDAIPFINASELPTIMAGDWNEMHAKSFAARVIGLVFRAPHKGPRQRAIQIGVENGRMNVAFPANGRSVAQAFGRGLDGFNNILLRLCR